MTFDKDHGTAEEDLQVRQKQSIRLRHNVQLVATKRDHKGLVGAARPPSLLAGASLKYFTL